MRPSLPEAALARSAPPRPTPYLPLTPSDRYDKLARFGWRLGAGPAVSLDEPIDWSEPEPALRSWHYHLQALDPIEPALVQWSSTGDRRALELAVSVALDWSNAHELNSEDPAVWYDMAVGLRAYRLAYLLGEGLAASLIPAEQENRLLRFFQRHLEHLVDEKRFSAHSNHGFYQAAGLLALARRVLRPADREAGTDFALARLRLILGTHFSADGVHKEHSPDYHLAVLEGFKALIRADLLDDPAMFEQIARAERALSWFVKPDGRLVNFGDSDSRLITPAVLEDLQPLKTGMRAFAEGGYAVIRGRGERGATYLAQTLCFHSRTHKQADDLSLVWTDRDLDILVDAGRYAYGAKTEQGSDPWLDGFWYSDPIRMFVESTAAHNTVEIGGRSFDRRARPYGSALEAAGELGGVRYVLGSVRHGKVSHTRLLLLSPGQWLAVVDGLEQRGVGDRLFRQWHHLAPGWTVEPSGRGFVATRADDGPAETLTIRSLDEKAEPLGPFLGQTRPRRQGWWSPGANKIEPAPAFAFARRTAQTAFATVFAFGDVGPISGGIGFNPSLIGDMTLDIGRKRIKVTRTKGDLEIAFRSVKA